MALWSTPRGIEYDEPIVVRTPLGPPPLLLRVAAVVAVPLLLYALVATGQKALDNYRLNREADCGRRSSDCGRTTSTCNARLSLRGAMWPSKPSRVSSWG